MATVEQIARVLAEHGCGSVSWVDGDAICATCDRVVGRADDPIEEIDIENRHAAEQIAALDGATSTEWAARCSEHPDELIGCKDQIGAAVFAGKASVRSHWEVVSRQVTEWRPVDGE